MHRGHRSALTSGSSRSRQGRPADLAPDTAQAAVITGAIHHAAGTLAFIAGTDLSAVEAAHRAGRLYMPTCKLPDYYDVSHRHLQAAPSKIAALLDAYQAPSAATSRAATDLDSLAVAMNAPSQILATATAATSTARAGTTDMALRRPSEPVSGPPP